MLAAVTDVLDLDAVGQAAAVRSGDLSARELVEASIARIAAVNPTLNAVIHEHFERAVALASSNELPAGPFRGVPILLKDAAMAAGDPCFLGMAALRDADFRAPLDFEFVARLRRAGFVLLGRTNTPELLNQATTEPTAFGATSNPWDTTRIAGGSSGGSAAAVASGMVAVAHANDGGGSIRIPASVCGLVGLKPTRGRVSRAPLPEAVGGSGCEFAVTRTVRDTAALLDVMAGSMPGDPHPLDPLVETFAGLADRPPGALRVAVMPHPVGDLESHPAMVAAVEVATEALLSLGHTVVEQPPRLPRFERMLPLLVDHWAISTASSVHQMSAAIGRTIALDELEPTNAVLVERAGQVTALAQNETAGWFASIARSLGQWWADGHDLLVTPTVRTPTPALGELIPPGGDPLSAWTRQWDWIPFTALWNVLGNPAISLPLHLDGEGLPVGVQLVAAHGREDLLLQVAAQLERAVPWKHRHPPALA
jgi:amidase